MTASFSFTGPTAFAGTGAMEEDAINEAAVADAVLRNARREGASELEVDAVNVLLLLL